MNLDATQTGAAMGPAMMERIADGIRLTNCIEAHPWNGPSAADIEELGRRMYWAGYEEQMRRNGEILEKLRRACPPRGVPMFTGPADRRLCPAMLAVAKGLPCDGQLGLMAL